METSALALLCATLSGQSLGDVLPPPKPAVPGRAVVIGLLGGFDRWNDSNRGVRKVALRLRESEPGFIVSETFTNRRRKSATTYLLRALDTNGDGRLSTAEKSSARVVLFGQSLGGSQAIAMARDLSRRGIPVLLTVQVDSVGLRDNTIPANVRSAANFYQKEILTFRGQTEIHPADPAKTRILANTRFHYPPFLPSYSRPESWARQKLGGAHARLEADPILWTQVEALIRKAIAEAN